MAGVSIFNVGTTPVRLSKGAHSGILKIPGKLLNDDVYTISLYFVKDTASVVYVIDELLTFEVVDEPRDNAWFGKWPGAVRPSLEFSIK